MVASMTKTVSGHDAIKFSLSPHLRKCTVPGRPIWIRVSREYAPLFLRLMVLLDQVEKLTQRNTWSYNYRPPRMGSASSVSDHAGYAIDCWSDGIGTHTWPSRMPAVDAKKISAILKGFKTPSGELVFGWGACKDAPGVDYPNTYSKHASNDPMHFYIAPGITPADAVIAIKHLGILKDGTIA